jgi:hypothetical protein
MSFNFTARIGWRNILEWIKPWAVAAANRNTGQHRLDTQCQVNIRRNMIESQEPAEISNFWYKITHSNFTSTGLKYSGCQILDQ